MNARWVIEFERLWRGDVSSVDGKNASLGELVRSLAPAGVQVPPGFATTADAYWEFVAEFSWDAASTPYR